MKRKLINFIPLTCLFFIPLLGSCSNNSEGLSIFNVGEYIDESLVTKFEKTYNCKVNYSTFESNEAAITKMKTEQFDIVVPSDYALEQMIVDDMIEEIDWSKLSVCKKEIMTPSVLTIIENLKNSENGYDLLKYGVPYFFGQVGILYDENKVDITDLESLGWNIFKDPKYKGLTTYYDSSRDGFMVAEKALGYSMNTTNEAEIEDAFNWILDVKKNTNPAFKTDELLSEMPSGKYALGLMYSGDAIYCMDIEDENVSLNFYVPNTGTNVFIDSLVIQKGAKNKDLAYKFIDFMYEYDNAYLNSVYTAYSSPVKEVYENIVSSDGDYYEEDDNGNNIYKNLYQFSPKKSDEIYRYNEELKLKMNDYWVKLKLY